MKWIQNFLSRHSKTDRYREDSYPWYKEFKIVEYDRNVESVYLDSVNRSRRSNYTTVVIEEINAKH